MMRRQVLITGVDMARSTCAVKDSTGGEFLAAIDSSVTPLQIPSPGEVWVALRDRYTWLLQGRVDNVGMAQQIASASPGDIIMSSPGGIQLQAASLTFNGAGIGSPTTDTFTSDMSGEYLLSVEPISDEGVRVQYGMAVLNPHEYIVLGRRLQLHEDFASDIPITCRYYCVVPPSHSRDTLEVHVALEWDEAFEDN